MRTSKWKRLTAITLIMAFVLCLSGCIRYKTDAKVGKDGKVNFTMMYAMMDMSDFSDDSESLSNDDMMSEDQKKTLTDAGWTYEEYTGESDDMYQYLGYIISKDGIALDDLEKELSSDAINITGFTCRKEGEVYIIDWNLGATQSEASGSGLDSESMESCGGYMKFELELPNGALSHNAKSEDGNKFSWDLLDMTTSIHIEFTLDGSEPDGYVPGTPSQVETDPTTDTTTETTPEPTTEMTTTEAPTETTTEETEEETKKTKKTKKTKADDEDEDDEDEPSEKKSKKDKKSSSKDSDGFPMWLIFVIGGVVVVAAAVVIIVVVKKKNGNNNQLN